MRREKEAIEHECDGCGRRFVVYKGEELPDGFHGDVFRISSGGVGGKWFACTEKCIKAAVLRGIEISLMNPDEYEELLKQ